MSFNDDTSLPYDVRLKNAKQHYDKKKNTMRHTFNREAFDSTNSSQNVKVRKDDDVNYKIFVLQNWHNKAFRLNRIGYDWFDRYEVNYRQVNGKSVPYLECLKEKHDREVVPESMIFDIIYEQHSRIGHKG